MIFRLECWVLDRNVFFDWSAWEIDFFVLARSNSRHDPPVADCDWYASDGANDKVQPPWDPPWLDEWDDPQ